MHRSLSLGLSMAMLAIPMASCVESDGPSIFISGHVAPDDECTLSPSNQLVLLGTFNVEFGSEYLLFPLLNNQLVNRGSNAPLMADPNIVQIQGAEIEIQDAAGNPIAFGGLPNPFTVLTQNTVPSTDAPGTSGQTVGGIVVVPSLYRQALFEQGLGGAGGDPSTFSTIVVSVTAFGETVGGVDVESEPFTWPIQICRGNCLVFAPSTPDEEPPVCCTQFQDFNCAP